MTIALENVRAVLDALRGAGLSVDDIVTRLRLWEVRSNARTVRHWYAGRTNCRTVEYMALLALLDKTENR